MTLSAHHVAAVLRARIPGLGVLKLHKLLYYCQGHHLATFDRPLFAEAVVAFDNGPVVGALWDQERHGEAPPAQDVDEAGLNTVGYVLSRYGGLSGRDLIRLTHDETPWKLANETRRPGSTAVIKHEWMRGYFRTDGDALADTDEGDIPSASDLKAFLDSITAPMADAPADTPDAFAAFTRRWAHA
jgi:uncharacterized phage-associated protein